MLRVVTPCARKVGCFPITVNSIVFPRRKEGGRCEGKEIVFSRKGAKVGGGNGKRHKLATRSVRDESYFAANGNDATQRSLTEGVKKTLSGGAQVWWSTCRTKEGGRAGRRPRSACTRSVSRPQLFEYAV